MSFRGSNALHYLRYRVGLDEAQTQITAAERELLRDLAPGRKVIVELGVFEGVSGRIMRAAMDDDAEIFCVDPFPAGRLLFSPQLGISRREISKARKGRMHLIRGYSFDAVRAWTKAIDLIFLSGDMSFEGMHRDFMEWARFVRKGGLVLIQGGCSSPIKPMPEWCGPTRLVKEIVAKDPSFRVNSFTDTIAVVEKL